MSNHASPPPTRIVDLRPSLQPVTVHFIVLERGEVSIVRKPEGGTVKEVPHSTARVADGSGSVTLQLVGADECAPGALCPGDTYALRGGLFTAERGGGNALRAGRKGVLERTGYLTALMAESPDMSAVRFEADGSGLNQPVDPLPARAWAPPGG